VLLANCDYDEDFRQEILRGIADILIRGKINAKLLRDLNRLHHSVRNLLPLRFTVFRTAEGKHQRTVFTR